MNSTATDFVIDAKGCCNYCNEFYARYGIGISQPSLDDDERLKRLVQSLKDEGKGSPYDCVVGISGGIDSSFVLMKAVDLGLRVLAVHMDNGWNSELAQFNIARLVKGLGVDLWTHVIEWDEYRQLVRAFLDADVLDVELLYDNAMLSVNYNTAWRFRTKSILSGSNVATEGMRVPSAWNWLKYDARNIRAIAKASQIPLQTLQPMGTLRYAYFRGVRQIRWIPFLDYLGYNREGAIREMVDRVGFRPYPYKHYESILTRYYQGVILPRKFGIDKRRLHLSNLIVTGQTTREEALDLLAQSTYPDPDDARRDARYVAKKIGWSDEDLEAYLSRPARPHTDFASERRLWAIARLAARKLGIEA